jgi:hypothetical protein
VTPDLSAVTPVAAMEGDDAEDTALLGAAYREAIKYLESFSWVRAIKESYYGTGVGGIVAAFLFRIEPDPPADQWLWVVVGDLPPCYMVTDRAPTGVDALRVYCELMEEWVRLAQSGTDPKNAFPVAAKPTPENAAALSRRLATLRDRVIPALAARKVLVRHHPDR